MLLAAMFTICVCLSVCRDPVSQFLWHDGQDGGKKWFDSVSLITAFLYLLTLYKNSKQKRTAKEKKSLTNMQIMDIIC